LEKQDIIRIIQDNLDHAGYCADKDWEFNSGGNGINPCEAYAALKGLAKEVNALAGEQVIKFDYNEEEMKEIYKGYGYPVDDDEDEDE
jgi:hypothetical protein